MRGGPRNVDYKNHVNVDATHKLVRRYHVADASVHDSRQLDGLLDRANTSREVFADSAYRSAETQVKLRRQGFLSRINTRSARNHPRSDVQINANRRRSKVQVRIEHVFGAQETAPGGRLVRVVGLVQAKAKIGLQNLAYNIRRMAFLERAAATA